PGRDQVTWLGHACAMVQAGSTTVWVDPFFYPKLRWLDSERSEIFSSDYADSLLVEPYDPSFEQLSMHHLPVPDAILVTHQDTDHFSLNALMMLPEKTIIVVPQARPGRPWEIDLQELIHNVLGEHRKVAVLPHGQHLDVGDVRITAFPFCGEFPLCLPHDWNCYLVEAERSAVVFAADSAMQREQVDFLSARLRGTERGTILFSRGPTRSNRALPGYRDELNQLFSSVR